MAIKLISDSTCDLTPELLERYDITLAPLYVTQDGVTRRDGVDIHPQDIFDHVAAGGSLPSTSAVNIADYQELFAKYAQEYDAVIHFNIGQSFSACHQNAVIAAEDFGNVYVVDTRNLTMGQGLLVVEAAEAARRGMAAQDIVEMVNSLIDKVATTFVVDRLYYLAKGGRCSSVVALGANLSSSSPASCCLTARWRWERSTGAFLTRSYWTMCGISWAPATTAGTGASLSTPPASRRRWPRFRPWWTSTALTRSSWRRRDVPSPPTAGPTPWACCS